MNLLPSDIKARQRQRRTLTIVTGAGVLVLVLLGLVLLIQRGTIGREEDTLQDLQGQRQALAEQVARLQEFGDLQASVEQRRQTLGAALSGDVAWSRFMNDLSLIMPDNSWLVNLSLSSAPGVAPNGEASVGTVTFSGFVFDFPGLAGWLTRVAQIDGLTFLYLTNGSKSAIGTSEVVSFGSNANLTPPLLSQRCQGPDKPCP
jgi:Tfp pilus assembly protein PilN